MRDTKKAYIKYIEDNINNLMVEYYNLHSFDSIKNYGPFAIYGEKKSYFELFSRCTYGIIISCSVGNSIGLEFFNSVITEGVNPNSKDYWGDPCPGQMVVDMPTLVLALVLLKEKTWLTYSAENQCRIISWFSKINKIRIVKTNWVFFHLLTNTCISLLDTSYKWDSSKAYAIIDKQYIGNGWYQDGNSGQLDYYNAWGFHFYSMLLYYVNPTKENSNLIKRTEEFKNEFCYWFDKYGNGIPYGRSLTYRMAQVAFYSMYILSHSSINIADLKAFKNIILKNIDNWLQTPIIGFKGLQTVGYKYQNPYMAESYNAFGSPYWSFKGFLFLILDDAHPFWDIDLKEAKMEPHLFSPTSKKNYYRSGNQALMFPGNTVTNPSYIDNFDAKYNKYCYSTLHGFSVSRENGVFSHGAYDLTTVVDVGIGGFIPRSRIIESNCEDGVNYSKWHPYKGVLIESIVICGLPWHVRIQKISTLADINIYEGGFCVPEGAVEEKNNQNLFIRNDNLVSGVVIYDDNGQLRVSHNESSTNVCFPYAEMPYVKWSLKKGKYVLISSFCGEKSDSMIVKDMPQISIKSKMICVIMGNRVYEIDFSDYRVPYSTRLKRNVLKRIYSLAKSAIELAKS